MWQIRAASVSLWCQETLKGEICFLPSNPSRWLIKCLSLLANGQPAKWWVSWMTQIHRHTYTLRQMDKFILYRDRKVKQAWGEAYKCTVTLCHCARTRSHPSVTMLYWLGVTQYITAWQHTHTYRCPSLDTHMCNNRYIDTHKEHLFIVTVRQIEWLEVSAGGWVKILRLLGQLGSPPEGGGWNWLKRKGQQLQQKREWL